MRGCGARSAYVYSAFRMSTQSIHVGVFGASGYTGGELLRYLASHPAFELVWATADRNAGRPVGELFGHVPAFADLVLHETDPDRAPELDLAFLALPHGEAAETGRVLAARGTRVIDLSADWRLQDPSLYEAWYGWSHPHPDALPSWVYGLPELHRDDIIGAAQVANPGCYPTAALLALVPPLREGAIVPDGIIIDAVSGVSGAGRKVQADFLFSELEASFKAYGVATHRHTPEIEQELARAGGGEARIVFTPHLAPMARGELVTCYARLAGAPTAVRDALETAYKGEPFVHVLPEGRQPATKEVSGSNHARIGISVDSRTHTAILTSAIDNLGKGAAGQALQNANLMCGLDETSGLLQAGVYP